MSSQSIYNASYVDFPSSEQCRKIIRRFLIRSWKQKVDVICDSELSQNLQSWVTLFNSLVCKNSLCIQHLIFYFNLTLDLYCHVHTQDDRLGSSFDVSSSQSSSVKRAAINDVDHGEPCYAVPNVTRKCLIGRCNNDDMLPVSIEVLSSEGQQEVEDRRMNAANNNMVLNVGIQLMLLCDLHKGLGFLKQVVFFHWVLYYILGCLFLFLLFLSLFSHVSDHS